MPLPSATATFVLHHAAVALFMYSLPHPPTFPVFGMDDQFDGFRWLVMWNNREHFHTVTLGHGHPEQGPGVSVTTIHKTPERRIDDFASSGPTGYEDAWFDATYKLSEQSFPHDKPAAVAVLHSAGDPHRIDAAERPEDLGPQWAPVRISIDGVDHPAARREAGEACAYLIDLPHVAIAVNGPTDMLASGLALADDTAHLGRYH